VILDPAPARALPKEMLGGLYLLTPNETEAEILTGLAVDDPGSATQAATQLLAVGVRNVAITLGAQGVLLANDQGSELIGTPAVTALDTTAAGDCFNGSLAVALGRGDDLRDAMAFACKAAAISVTRMGAQDSMPYSHEIDA
jgi:ribokinase